MRRSRLSHFAVEKSMRRSRLSHFAVEKSERRSRLSHFAAEKSGRGGRLSRFAVKKSGRRGRLSHFAVEKSGRRGRLSHFAVEKSGRRGRLCRFAVANSQRSGRLCRFAVANSQRSGRLSGGSPRGPAISGSPWLETAAPSRVNFRQIRGPGVSEAKIQSDRPEGRHDGSEAVISQKTKQGKRKAQTRCESVLDAFIAAYFALPVPQEGKCCSDNPVRLR